MMDDLNLPNTDSPEVMQQAVSLHITHIVWEQVSRAIDPDSTESAILEIYKRVYSSIYSSHKSG